VRDVIKEYQPLLGLHGHIHEGKGAVRVGKTLCINPGSMYEQGRLLGAVVNLARDKVKSYILTTG
jgi:Icc-related predicted phosphoesterase